MQSYRHLSRIDAQVKQLFGEHVECVQRKFAEGAMGTPAEQGEEEEEWRSPNEDDDEDDY